MQVTERSTVVVGQYAGLVGLALALVTAANAGAQESMAPAQAARAEAPAIGDPAPDFMLPSGSSGGVRGMVRLADLKGQVVVVAFYPGDKTTGCTAELSKFRDDQATLFGPDVVVLPISVDGLDSHVAWASEMHFPFALLSDSSQVVARQYGSTLPGKPYDNRTVFVVGRDGRISYRELRFGALNASAYRDLAHAVAVAKADAGT
jgi:peroxiredoxin Q/BCP